jgi:hypothetical protein
MSIAHLGHEADDVAAEDPANESWTVTSVLQLLEDTAVFHSPSGEQYISMKVGGVLQTITLHSDHMREVLRLHCFDQSKSLPFKHVVDSVVDVLAARARAVERRVFVRIGTYDDRLYVDLGDPLWRAVEIDGDGYRIVATPPVYFRRPRGMLDLPEPQDGGSVYDFARLVSVDPDDFDLLVLFLLGVYLADGPFPVLDLNGDAGSGKTLSSRMVRMLVDPNSAALRSEPREPRDVMVAATNSWLVALDNLSSMPKALADAICRITSGVGASYRKNYSDDDEVLFDACRPVLVNGIDDLDDRYDLRDRMLSVRCLPIPESQRRREADIMRDFVAMRPKLLGALCEATSKALAGRDAIAASKPALPRLADLAVHGEAAREALGWEAGKAIALLRDHGIAARQRILHEDVVAQSIVAFAGAHCGFKPWTGTATELEGALVREGLNTPNAARLSTRLNRLSPTLRDAGIAITRSRVGHAGRRMIMIMLTPQTKRD